MGFNKKFLFLFCLAILILGIANVSASEINSQYNLIDDVNPIIDDYKTFDDVNVLITSTTSNTVYLKNSTYGAGEKGPIVINSDIAFYGGFNENDGKMSTFDGLKFSGIFTINENCSVSFININFINAYNESGSAIFASKGSFISFENCNFVDNVGYNGAAVLGFDIAVDGCNFVDNCAEFKGGSISAFNNLKVTNSNFIHNSAGYFGGALSIDCKNPVVISNCNFTNNEVSSQWHEFLGYPMGGAIFINSGNVKIDNSNFRKNKVAGFGGAISSYDVINILDSVFESNSALVGGGAISISSTEDLHDFDVTIRSSTFNNNIGKMAGAIFVNSFNDDLIDINIINSNFNNNSADGGCAGSIYAAANILVVGCSFNDAKSNGGSVIFVPNTGKLNNVGSNFNSNLANTNNNLNLIVKQGEIQNNVIRLNIYTPFSNDGNIIIYLNKNKVKTLNVSQDSTLYVADIDNLDQGENEITVEFVESNVFSQASKTITIINGVVQSFGDLQSLIDKSSGVVYLENGYFRANTNKPVNINKNLVIYGGADFNDDKMAIIDGCGISSIFNVRGCNNVTIYNVKFINGKSDYGGVININNFFGDINITISNCVFADNRANNGGVIFTEYYKDSNVIIKNSTFSNNSATQSGSIYYSEGRNNIEIYNSSFSNNSAVSISFKFNGNLKVVKSDFRDNNNDFIGVFNFDGIGEIHDSSFIDNSAISGAIINGAAELDIYNSTFINNHANSGGVVFSVKKVNMYNSNFINNSASYGGIVNVGTNSLISIQNSNFVNNSVTSEGGVIYSSNAGTTTSISNSNFTSNTAYNGGVVYGGSVTTSKSNFDNNRAENEGYSIYANGNVVVIDSLFSNYQSCEIHSPGLINVSSFFELKIPIKIICNPVVIYYGGIPELNIEVRDDLGNPVVGVELNITIDNVTYQRITNSEGKIVLDFNLSIGKYDVSIVYDGDKYYSLNILSNITVKSTILADGVEAVFGKDLRIGASFLNENGFSLYNRQVKFIIGDKEYGSYTNSNGFAYITPELNAGIYNCSVINPRTGQNMTFTIEILPLDKINMNLSVEVTKDDVFITAVFPDEVLGEVLFEVEGVNYTVNITNKRAVLQLYALENGNYTVLAILNSINYKNVTNSTSFSINSFRSPLNLIADNLVMYYNNGSKFVVEAIDKQGNPISGIKLYIYLNGETYIRTTNEMGIASRDIELPVGNYSVKVRFNGSDIYKVCEIEKYILIKTTIFGENMTKIFRNETQYHAKFLDAVGNPLTGVKVQFNINGIFYERTPDAFGVAKLDINLPPGRYILTALNTINGEMISNIVVVFSNMEADNVTKYFQNNSQYHIKLFDNQGNPAIGVRVTFNINGVFYSRISNSSGMATLDINLPPGEYILTAMFNGLSMSNKIVVLSFIKSSNLTMFDSQRVPFEVTVYNKQGKLATNGLLIFNINGIFYNRTVNGVGSVKLDINLPKGEYIITTEFDGLMQSNTILIKEDVINPFS